MTGGSSQQERDASHQAWKAMIAASDQKQADLKKEIVLGLLDPKNQIKQPSHISVNQQAPKPVVKNAPTIYDLPTNEYKDGPLGLLWQDGDNITQAILYPQVRHINVQDPNLDMQLPKPWFNERGQLPIVISVDKAHGSVNVDNLDFVAVMAMAPELAPAMLADGLHDISGLDEISLDWLSETVGFFYKHDVASDSAAEIGQLMSSVQKLC